MENTTDADRVRPELRCIAVAEPIWQQAKELASSDGRSISSYIREVIKRQYRKEKKQEINSSRLKIKIPLLCDGASY